MGNSLLKTFTIIFCLFTFPLSGLFAQGELNCTINLDYENIELSADAKSALNDLKTVITDFMNTRKWTTDNFNLEERITVNMIIRFSSIPPDGQGEYAAKAFLKSSRPVYGSTYESVQLNFLDENFNFTFTRGTVLDFNENMYISNLTSMLGFYANVIIGLDYDTFSKLGGTPYFEKARNVVMTAPSEGGWKQMSDPNNRAALAENLTSQQIVPMREGMYTYHRLILDNFLKDPTGNYSKIIDILQAIKGFNDVKRPNATMVRNFFTAKTGELVGIFSEAPNDVKQKAMAYFSELDPTNVQKYQKIFGNN